MSPDPNVTATSTPRGGGVPKYLLSSTTQRCEQGMLLSVLTQAKWRDPLKWLHPVLLEDGLQWHCLTCPQVAYQAPAWPHSIECSSQRTAFCHYLAYCSSCVLQDAGWAIVAKLPSCQGALLWMPVEFHPWLEQWPHLCGHWAERPQPCR